MIQPDPPVDCRTCQYRENCAKCENHAPCSILDEWLDDTYRDHYSIDTPEEHRWPTPDKED